MQYEKEGTIYEFSLDLDKIADLEEADPTFDLMAILDTFEKGTVRFSALRKLATLLGTSFSDMNDKGLDVSDLLKIFTGCIGELGFSSETPE